MGREGIDQAAAGGLLLGIKQQQRKEERPPVTELRTDGAAGASGKAQGRWVAGGSPGSVCCGKVVRCGGDLPPNPRAALWLIGAVLVKQQDERDARRRYFGLASMAAPYGAQGEQENPVEAVEEVLTG